MILSKACSLLVMPRSIILSASFHRSQAFLKLLLRNVLYKRLSQVLKNYLISATYRNPYIALLWAERGCLLNPTLVGSGTAFSPYWAPDSVGAVEIWGNMYPRTTVCDWEQKFPGLWWFFNIWEVLLSQDNSPSGPCKFSMSVYEEWKKKQTNPEKKTYFNENDASV